MKAALVNIANDNVIDPMVDPMMFVDDQGAKLLTLPSQNGPVDLKS